MALSASFPAWQLLLKGEICFLLFPLVFRFLLRNLCSFNSSVLIEKDYRQDLIHSLIRWEDFFSTWPVDVEWEELIRKWIGAWRNSFLSLHIQTLDGRREKQTDRDREKKTENSIVSTCQLWSFPMILSSWMKSQLDSIPYFRLIFLV